MDYAGPASWRWRLTDAGGRFVADHVVALDPGDWQFEAFADLHEYLRWNVASDQRLGREAELVRQVGDWIGERVLGPVGVALARARRGGAGRGAGRGGGLGVPAVGASPELARIDGQTLAARRVTFVIDQQPRRPLGKAEVGDRLRMLSVFSLPEGAGALNLRKERFELARLVHEIAKVNNKGIELRVLQYGADHAEQLVATWEPVQSALYASLHHPDPHHPRHRRPHPHPSPRYPRPKPELADPGFGLRQIHAGDHVSTDGLDPIDTAIVQRAPDILAGTATTDPDAWRGLIGDAETEQGEHAETIVPPEPPTNSQESA